MRALAVVAVLICISTLSCDARTISQLIKHVKELELIGHYTLDPICLTTDLLAVPEVEEGTPIPEDEFDKAVHQIKATVRRIREEKKGSASEALKQRIFVILGGGDLGPNARRESHFTNYREKGAPFHYSNRILEALHARFVTLFEDKELEDTNFLIIPGTLQMRKGETTKMGAFVDKTLEGDERPFFVAAPVFTSLHDTTRPSEDVEIHRKTGGLFKFVVSDRDRLSFAAYFTKLKADCTELRKMSGGPDCFPFYHQAPSPVVWYRDTPFVIHFESDLAQAKREQSTDDEIKLDANGLLTYGLGFADPQANVVLGHWDVSQPRSRIIQCAASTGLVDLKPEPKFALGPSE